MIESLVEERISRLGADKGDGAKEARALAVVLPGGRRIGPAGADVVLKLASLAPLRHLVTGNIGGLASDCVEGLVEIEGPMRRVVEVAAGLLHADPTEGGAGRRVGRTMLSRWRHRKAADARQIQHHYDVSDDFYALWLDPRRVYSCAYWPEPGMTLAAAQEAKLEHVCRKLMLRPGDRFLDIGAGWGGLLLWAAEHHGVRATGITLSRNQHAHVNHLIAERGLSDRVRMLLLDYRDLPEDEPYDKIASIGMFEHVGRARLPTYFAKIRRLLAPGGLLLNHGITAGGTRHTQLGGGIGDFIERWIFPGGELLHVSHVLEAMAEQGLEGLDTENLRPHYARTLWAWSDALEARLESARKHTDERTVRAYRLYLAGSALGFERGWMALHQMLASRPSGRFDEGQLRGSQCVYPFRRDYMYRR
ncbi:MAG: class I SAM-dependent methyltransferase [Rubrivivax sp.]|nr:class I SAM-dependent methyltransferase [Rubrivivax sp.]